jgi:hypothetical protein
MKISVRLLRVCWDTNTMKYKKVTLTFINSSTIVVLPLLLFDSFRFSVQAVLVVFFIVVFFFFSIIRGQLATIFVLPLLLLDSFRFSVVFFFFTTVVFIEEN